MSEDSIGKALQLIFQGIDLLRTSHDGRRLFTIDGRLVGDIGEIIAAREFDSELDLKSRAHHDAKTRDGKDVQIKATFKDNLTFTTVPVLFLGLKLDKTGGHEVIFNGPGQVISEAFSTRKGIGIRQLSFPINRLKALSETIAEDDRVPRRMPS
jgi:hypothetical protein